MCPTRASPLAAVLPVTVSSLYLCTELSLNDCLLKANDVNEGEEKKMLASEVSYTVTYYYKYTKPCAAVNVSDTTKIMSLKCACCELAQTGTHS